MSAESEREERIFERALGLSSFQEREACLIEACGADAAMRRKLAALLRAHDRVGQFLAEPGGEAERAPAGKPGDRIGRFQLCGFLPHAPSQFERRGFLGKIELNFET